MQCPVCQGKAPSAYRLISGVAYFKCRDCGTLFADPAFLDKIEAGQVQNYDTEYWKTELQDARDRSFSNSLQRVAEIFLYCRIPIRNFVDIGSGPGYLLDALSMVMPASRLLFHAVEMFPPPEAYRTLHPNYKIGSIGSVPTMFEAGCCIEVIEHLTPTMLHGLVKQMAERSVPGATYYFGSGNPDYVEKEDPAYLDPQRRGHIVAYSLKGLAPIFATYGFNLIPLPGRDWAFLAEFGPENKCSAADLLSRIWTAHPENLACLKDAEFGPLMYAMGIESARCYLEHAVSEARRQRLLQLEPWVKFAQDTLRLARAIARTVVRLTVRLPLRILSKTRRTLVPRAGDRNP
jgi:hypothetical protein